MGECDDDLEMHRIICYRMLREAGYGYLADELEFHGGAAWFPSRALTDEERVAVFPIIAGALRPVNPGGPNG
jgi:hypothetical protein